MSSSSDCPICGRIPDRCSAFVKGGEVREPLPAGFDLLEPTYINDYQVAGRGSYEKSCPACGAIFQLVTDYEYLVGGTEDTIEVTRTGRHATPTAATPSPPPTTTEAVQEQLRGLLAARAVAVHRKNYGYATDREIDEIDAKLAALPSRDLLEPLTVRLENPWQHDAFVEEIVIPASVSSPPPVASEPAISVPIANSLRCDRCGATDDSTITAVAFELETRRCERCGFEWTRSMFDPTD